MKKRFHSSKQISVNSSEEMAEQVIHEDHVSPLLQIWQQLGFAVAAKDFAVTRWCQLSSHLVNEERQLSPTLVPIEAYIMQIVNRIREFHDWLLAWSHALVGELIALSQPRTEDRR